MNNTYNKIIYQPYELLKLRHSKKFNIYIKDLQKSPHYPIPNDKYPSYTNNDHYRNRFKSYEQVGIPVYAPINIIPIIKIEPGMIIPEGGIQIYINSPISPTLPTSPPLAIPHIIPFAPTPRVSHKSRYSARYASSVKQFIPSRNTIYDIPEETMSSSSSDVIIQI